MNLPHSWITGSGFPEPENGSAPLSPSHDHEAPLAGTWPSEGAVSGPWEVEWIDIGGEG